MLLLNLHNKQCQMLNNVTNCWSDKHITRPNPQLELHVVALIGMVGFGGFQKMEKEYVETTQLSCQSYIPSDILVETSDGSRDTKQYHLLRSVC